MTIAVWTLIASEDESKDGILSNFLALRSEEAQA